MSATVLYPSGRLPLFIYPLSFREPHTPEACFPRIYGESPYFQNLTVEVDTSSFEEIDRTKMEIVELLKELAKSEGVRFTQPV